MFDQNVELVFKGAPVGNKNAAGKHNNHPGQHSDSSPRTDTQQKSHEKDLDSENWHTKTMAKFKDTSNASLKYIIKDASAAIKAMPDGKKAGQYADEIHYASMELKKRGVTKEEGDPSPFIHIFKEHIGFKALVAKLIAQGNSPEAAARIAASLGRKKYGAKGMANLAKKEDCLAIKSYNSSLMGRPKKRRIPNQSNVKADIATIHASLLSANS